MDAYVNDLVSTPWSGRRRYCHQVSTQVSFTPPPADELTSH
jgi:hypothetical protein